MAIWRPVPGYESSYEVSDGGEVRRLAGFWCRSNRLLKRHMSNSGYYRVCLTKRGHRNPHKFTVHRLVWRAFRGEIPRDMTVNHIDGHKTNNVLSNLELSTMSEQMQHAYVTGLQPISRGEARGRVAKLTENIVRDIRSRYRRRVVTYAVLAEEYGVSTGCVLSIVRRRTWQHI